MSKDNLLSKVVNRAKKTFSSLKHMEFRYFWFGQIISWTGTWIQRTAQVWLAYTLTNSPLH